MAAKSKLWIEIIGKDKATPALKKVNKSLGETEKATSLVSKAWKVAGAAVVAGAGALIVESTKLAARVETLGVVTVKLGENIGWSEEKIRDLEQAIVDQGITLQKSRQAIAMMIQGNVDLAKATDLARLAQDAAVIANVNSSEAFEKLVYVIQTGNVRMARTLGLQADFQGSLKKLAKQLGKTTAELSEEETMLARTNAVMEAGARITGTYDAAMETAGKQLLSLDRYIEEFKVALGTLFIPALSLAVEWLTRFFTIMKDGLEVAQLLLTWNQRIAEATTENVDTYEEYYAVMEELFPVLDAHGKVLMAMTEEQWNAEAAIKAADNAMRGMEDAAGRYAVVAGTAAENTGAIARAMGEVTRAEIAADALARLDDIADEISQEDYDLMFRTIAGEIGGMSPGAITGRIALENLYKKIEEGDASIQDQLDLITLFSKAIHGLPSEKIINIVTRYSSTGKPYEALQHGGPLGPISKVGEAGWEYIIGNMVIPHDVSKKLEKLGLFGKSFQRGGSMLYETFGTTTTTPTFGYKFPEDVQAWARQTSGGGGSRTSRSIAPPAPIAAAQVAAEVASETAVQAIEEAVTEAVVGQIQPEVTQQTIAMTSQMAAQRRETQETNLLLAQVVSVLQAQASEDSLRSIMVESQDTSGF